MSLGKPVMPTVPDGASPLVGFREWSLRNPEDPAPELSSLFHPTVWPADRPLMAVCFRPMRWPYRAGPTHREVPDDGCECGIYAYLDPDFESLHGARGPKARGIVAGWGRFVFGTNGWRSQHARLVGLLEHSEHPEALRRVADRFGVPVVSSLVDARIGLLDPAA
ncbi:MAG TPA: hypothetical protein VLE71_00875 [Actinomycetota bacterium]|nr:hypothetical protein [Actinomycetota bacterium]